MFHEIEDQNLCIRTIHSVKADPVLLKKTQVLWNQSFGITEILPVLRGIGSLSKIDIHLFPQKFKNLFKELVGLRKICAIEILSITKIDFFVYS